MANITDQFVTSFSELYYTTGGESVPATQEQRDEYRKNNSILASRLREMKVEMSSGDWLDYMKENVVTISAFPNSKTELELYEDYLDSMDFLNII